MKTSWNKGFTKSTHPSVMKISQTMKRKKIDNFAIWRKKMKNIGRIKCRYQNFRKSGNLSELIGLILGDGHIGKFPRTESLRIVLNACNKGLIKRCADLINKVFCKKAYIAERNGPRCVNITIYEKYISKRLGIPVGTRKNKNINIPKWILENKEYLKRYLRGLYEAEGSFCIHKPTYTYKFLFSNKNESLLKNVYHALKILGFHPHKSKNKVQISKREEVYKIKDLIKFRQYQ